MSTKKIIGGVVILAALGFAYYAISPLFRNVVVDDALPESVVDNNTTSSVSSGEENLTPEEKAQMEQEMIAINAEGSIEQNESMPETSETTTVSFDADVTFPVMATAGHPAEGQVRVVPTAEGTIVRFEDYKTINGPRLHIYLAKDLKANEFIDLGPIRGTEGNINYTVPEGVDVSEYRYVMAWCVPFSVLFNYAEIN